jgi:hypothetical protein
VPFILFSLHFISHKAKQVLVLTYLKSYARLFGLDKKELKIRDFWLKIYNIVNLPPPEAVA